MRSLQLSRWAMALLGLVLASSLRSAPSTPNFQYRVSWLGNSFSGASNQWVKNFFLHMNTSPDGTCHTWSNWDEGGRKFGVYRDGRVVGNEDVHANSLEVLDTQGRHWKIRPRWVDPAHNEYDFVSEGITVDGAAITLPDLFQPTELALATDGTLIVADSGTAIA